VAVVTGAARRIGLTIARTLALTRQIAAEYGPDNIRANAILPGLIVDHSPEAYSPQVERLAGTLYPVGRVGTFADVAAAVLYLVSDAACFVTAHS